MKLHFYACVERMLTTSESGLDPTCRTSKFDKFLSSLPGNTPFTYPVDTLTISGELDGLCRISRVAEVFNRQLDDRSGTLGLSSWSTLNRYN